jgi:hypothetical protein
VEFSLCALLALTTISQQIADAQVLYGTLVGTVLDQTKAVVAGASVEVTSSNTGVSRATITNSVGAYSLPNMPPGEYVLKVTAVGFRLYSRSRVDISINTITRADVELQVGDVTQAVTVGAEVAALQTDKADVHSELTTREITNLPLSNYRSFESLLDLVPGTTPARFSNTIDNEPARSLVHNINGTADASINNRLDGATNVFEWLPNHALYVPPSENIETVNITTNSFDAEQGLAGGAAINVTTKSGTNEFHGVTFLHHSNSELAARNFFYQAEKNPKNLINMYGANLGGPIKRDKMFFFIGWEGARQRQASSTTISGAGAGLMTVPTAEQRTGDFSSFGATLYDPMTGNPDGSGRMPFSNAVIPMSRQSAISRKMQDLLPLPNLPGAVANYAASTTMFFNRDLADVKVNWNPSQKSTFWGKYSLMEATAGDQFNLGPAGGLGLGAVAGSGDTFVQLATIGGTYLISPAIIMDATLGYTRLNQPVRSADYGTNFGLEYLGIPGTNGPDIRQSGMPWFSVNSYEGFGNAVGWSPSFRYDNTWTLTQNTSWVKGSHDIRFGADIARQNMNHFQPEIGGNGPRGRFRFTEGVTALRGGASPNQFNSWAAFLLGLPQQVGKSLQFYDPMSTRDWLHGYYIRDRWQATRSLTVTLGLRWEHYPMMTRAHSGIERYDPDTNQVLIGRYGGLPDNVGITVSKNLFAPRAGLAYRLGQRGVIRAGFGISIDPGSIGKPMRSPYPAVINQDFIGPNSFQPFGPTEQGIPFFTGPDLSSGLIDLPLTATTVTLPNGLFRRGYFESFNFTVERQLTDNFVASAGYVGTRTIRGRGSLNINAAPPGGGQAGRPLFERFGRSVDTTVHVASLTSNYNALQATLDRRFHAGMLLKVAYTWSKSIDYSGPSIYADVQARNRAVASFDRTHVLRVATVAELPFGAGKRWANSGVLQALAGGWQFNGVFSAYSGTPFTVSASATSLNAPGNSQTADQVKASVRKLGGIGPNSPFYDPLAFRAVTQVRFGNSGRNILRGPGVVNADVGVFRNFSLTERAQLQFRAEAFNFTNTPHFQNPSANVSNLRLNSSGEVQSLGGFMTITSAAADQRQLRFGMRISF